eukprot:3870277-Pleurochrysis_carterae.AAC.1
MFCSRPNGAAEQILGMRARFTHLTMRRSAEAVKCRSRLQHVSCLARQDSVLGARAPSFVQSRRNLDTGGQAALKATASEAQSGSARLLHCRQLAGLERRGACAARADQTFEALVVRVGVQGEKAL